MIEQASPVAELRFDGLLVRVFADSVSLGRSAADEVAAIMSGRQAEAAEARVVFAAAPSQDQLLRALVASPSIQWSRVVAFHMDEYLGLDAEHPASFRRYLREHVFGLVALDRGRLRLIPGERVDRPLGTCLAYEEMIRAEPPDLVVGGIGENGHLAFNDPPVADFSDPVFVKVVRLDPACRRQQVNDGAFASIDAVPTHAYTLTIPALMSAPRIVLAVPGSRKAAAVQKALRGPISESCPASILRRHPGATLYLDRESAALL